MLVNTFHAEMTVHAKIAIQSSDYALDVVFTNGGHRQTIAVEPGEVRSIWQQVKQRTSATCVALHCITCAHDFLHEPSEAPDFLSVLG